MRRFWGALTVVLALAAPAARADDVTGQINEALTAYRKGDLTTAIAGLEAAATLIRQQKTEAWKAALPEPLAGWTGGTPEGEAVPTALFGGGTTVSRKYRKPGERVTVTIMADSPIVQTLAGLMSSSIGSLLAGAQVLVIDGRRVLYNKQENSYQTLVDNRVLVKVEGTKNDAALRQYLSAVNFDQIDKLAK
jgi:hypothetical protein